MLEGKRTNILAFGAVVAAEPQNLRVRMRATFGLAVASEGLGERERARELYAVVVRDTDDAREARSASVRMLGLLAYLEAWPELGSAAAKLLERSDLDPVDRMTGLGARGLSRIEAGDVDGAQRDVQNGLDIARVMLAGASAAEISSPVMLRGFGLIERALAELSDYLNAKEILAQDLIGRAADVRKTFAEMPRLEGNWRNYVPKDALSSSVLDSRD